MHVQIVLFKLKPDTTRESFLKLTERMILWLRGREGFMAYELYQGSEYWSDRIVWKSAHHARKGLNDFLDTPIAKQLIALVEEGYDNFFGETVMTG